MVVAMHAAPTHVMIRKIEKTPHLVEITFFGPTLQSEGAKAIYPREDVTDWLARWLGSSYYKND